MDKYSFLNAAHTSFFSALYDKYLISPDSVEPSWRAFFQGFDFGTESAMDEGGSAVAEGTDTLRLSDDGNSREGDVEIPEFLQKEFKVVKMIDGYRSRGHLFTKTNPVRERRKYYPTPALENFGLSESDLDTVFSAGDILGIGPSTLRDIRKHLTNIYCDTIGVEYMYIRSPERIEWIQNWLNVNDNHPQFSAEK